MTAERKAKIVEIFHHSLKLASGVFTKILLE